MSKSPREALKNIIEFFEVIEKCDACIPLTGGRAIFTCHQARWEKLLREAKEAIKLSNN